MSLLIARITGREWNVFESAYRLADGIAYDSKSQNYLAHMIIMMEHV